VDDGIPVESSDDISTIALGFRILERGPSRLDLRPGWRFPLKSVFSARYRYLFDLGGGISGPVTETVYWVEGEGFGTTTRLELNRHLGEWTVLRWTSRGTYSEISTGLEWSTAWFLFRRLGRGNSIVPEIGLSGVTVPSTYVRSYRTAVRYRHRLQRWLHLHL